MAWRKSLPQLVFRDQFQLVWIGLYNENLSLLVWHGINARLRILGMRFQAPLVNAPAKGLRQFGIPAMNQTSFGYAIKTVADYYHRLLVAFDLCGPNRLARFNVDGPGFSPG